MGYPHETESAATQPGSGDKIGASTSPVQVRQKRPYPNRYVIFTMIGAALLGVIVGAGATILLLSHLLKL
jgi:hypothetical protein